MRGFLKRFTGGVALLALLGVFMHPAAVAAEKKDFKIASSIYVGWMPWDYMAKTGILKKWAEKYGIKIDVVLVEDYVESINQYTIGKFDGCAMTNMDALTMPATAGVDSTALIIGDFSNGNDGIVLKGRNRKLADIKNQKVNLVELSVSHYMLARGLESIKLVENDIKLVNTSDAIIVTAFKASEVTSVVTWNPQLSEIKGMPNSTLVFDSSKIPGEIIDLMVVKTQTLRDNPALGMALVGAWYETIKLMAKEDAAGKAARQAMAKASGTGLGGFNDQLKTTRMFYDPAEAVAFTRSPSLVRTMDYVRKFSFAHRLLGKGAKSADVVGMSFPGGKHLGSDKNLKLRFDASYMELAAAGKL
jgi:NitT/TauT family transport system substrate-binding protein